MSWGKYRKIQNFFCSNRKRSDKTDKDGNESILTMSHKIKFIDSLRFMAILLSNLVVNLAEGISKLKLMIVIGFLNIKLSRTN